MPAPVPAPAPAHTPAPRMTPPDPVSNRNALATAVFTIASLLVIALVAIGAWWFGSGYYGDIPALIV